MLYHASHAGPQAILAIDESNGRRIRIRRLFVTSDSNGSVEFVEDVGGTETRLLPILQARGGGTVLDLLFQQEFPTASVGKNVGYLTSIAGSYGIWIEFEYVN